MAGEGEELDAILQAVERLEQTSSVDAVILGGAAFSGLHRRMPLLRLPIIDAALSSAQQAETLMANRGLAG